MPDAYKLTHHYRDPDDWHPVYRVYRRWEGSAEWVKAASFSKEDDAHAFLKARCGGRPYWQPDAEYPAVEADPFVKSFKLAPDWDESTADPLIELWAPAGYRDSSWSPTRRAAFEDGIARLAGRLERLTTLAAVDAERHPEG
jgi:hypothetical protein